MAVLLAGVSEAEFQINTNTVGDQGSPAVAVDATGGSVVVWSDEHAVMARRFDERGAPAGAEFAVSPKPTVSQFDPVVAAAPSGDFVVAWFENGIVPPDGSESGVFARRFDALGVPAGTAFLVNTFTLGTQYAPVIAADAAGNFVIAWQSLEQDGDSGGIFAQRYDTNGMPVGGEFQVNTYTDDAQGDNGLAIAMAPDGRFTVSWRSRGQDDGNTTVHGGGVYAQRYAADGSAAGGEFRVNTTIEGGQGFAGVGAAMDAAGNLVIVWNHNEFEPFLPGGDIYGQRYDSAGTQLGGEFRVNQNQARPQFWPAVAADANGNFLVTFRGDDGDNAGMFARYFTADGLPTTVEFGLNRVVGGEQTGRSVAANASGEFAVAWQSSCNQNNSKCNVDQDGDGAGIFGQRFSAITPTCDATPLPGCNAAGTSRLSLDARGQGRMIWTWRKGTGFDITELGNPAAGLAGYALCLYVENAGPAALIAEARIPAAGLCDDKPCWAFGRKLIKAKYKDRNITDGTADGITFLDLKGSGRGRVSVKGSGPDLNLPLPVGPFTTVTTQVVNGLGACWQSEHDGPALANDAQRFMVR